MRNICFQLVTNVVNKIDDWLVNGFDKRSLEETVKGAANIDPEVVARLTNAVYRAYKFYEDFEAGHAKVDQNTIACRKTGKQGDKEWVILDESACERCNLVPDCDTEFDEVGCPVYTSPSFEYPVYCPFLIVHQNSKTFNISRTCEG